MTQQPKWVRKWATDTTALWVDSTGVYPPELTVIGEVFDASEEERFIVFRFGLDRCTYDYASGTLSDNPHHPEYPAWFSGKKLLSACECCGQEIKDVIEALCSDDPNQLAYGYQVIAACWGEHEFDSYPQQMSEDEAKKELEG